jgi:hypothetical protein
MNRQLNRTRVLKGQSCTREKQRVAIVRPERKQKSKIEHKRGENEKPLFVSVEVQAMDVRSALQLCRIPCWADGVKLGLIRYADLPRWRRPREDETEKGGGIQKVERA